MMTNKNKGFTLVEVLITVVILSIGLLGLAGLQLNSLRNNLGAEQQGKAAQLASDMVDRMRANTDRNNLPALNDYTGSEDEETACLSAPGCNPLDQAEHDLFEWQRDISNSLPSGQGSIGVAGDVYTITVEWDNNRSGAVDASFAIRFEP